MQQKHPIYSGVTPDQVDRERERATTKPAQDVQEYTPISRRPRDRTPEEQKRNGELERRMEAEREAIVREWEKIWVFLEEQKQILLKWLEGLARGIRHGSYLGASGETPLPCNMGGEKENIATHSPEEVSGTCSRRNEAFLQPEQRYLEFELRLIHFSEKRALVQEVLSRFQGALRLELQSLMGKTSADRLGSFCLPERHGMETLKLGQDFMTFEDVAVRFTKGEWALLNAPQRALYRDIMQENYKNVTSLVLALTKPDVISQLEQGDVTWIQHQGNSDESSTPGSAYCTEKSDCQNENEEGKLDPESAEHTNFYSTSSEKADETVSPSQETEGGPGKTVQESLIFMGEDWAPSEMLPKGERQQACNVCGRKFKKRSNLVRHQRTHTGEKPYTCADCGKSFSLNSSLVRHQRTHTGERPYTCAHCGRNFSQTSILIVHQRTHTGEKPFQCSICGKTFSRNLSLTSHQKKHTEEKLYKCSFCERSFGHGANLIAHERIHSEEKPFPCSKCGKEFHLSSNLIAHQRTHVLEKTEVSRPIELETVYIGERANKCSDCGKYFSHRAQLLRHQRLHTRVKSYRCLVCGKSFGQSSDLIEHERSHTGEKPFQCSVCGKRFGYNSNLTVHERIHAREKPYERTDHGGGIHFSSALQRACTEGIGAVEPKRNCQGQKSYKCSDCGRSFSQQAHLVRHQRIHTGEKPYTCSVCDKSFSQNSNLIAHKRIHTGEKPYQCSDCGKSFTCSSGLIGHVRIHTGEKPYQCMDCGKKFNLSSNLIAHQRTHMAEKPYKSMNSGESFYPSSDFEQLPKISHVESINIQQGGGASKNSPQSINYQMHYMGWD